MRHVIRGPKGVAVPRTNVLLGKNINRVSLTLGWSHALSSGSFAFNASGSAVSLTDFSLSAGHGRC